MLGAIIGDIVGSYYEFNSIKTTEFELFDPWICYTDDSVMANIIRQADCSACQLTREQHERC